jgi:hypothetical protein
MGMPYHPKYTQLTDKKKKEGKNDGGAFGYLGRGENYYKDAELKELGKGLVEWIKQEGNIWCKYYFLLLDYPISWDTIKKLRARSPEFDSYVTMALNIQESKLVSEPYDLRKKKDAYHARWILSHSHGKEWEDKPQVVTEQENEKLDKTTALVDHLQSVSDLNIADNNIKRADISKLETGDESA